MRTQMTTLGVRYSTESYHYPDKLSTNGRTLSKAIAPGGHLISVAIYASGAAYHSFYPRGGGKTVYMPGTLESRGGQLYFHPRREDHLEMLYTWDRERAPSQHMPVEIEQVAVAAA